jgi:rhamnose transport system permease protein
VGALSFEFALFILLAAAFTFLLHKTNFGRRTYAIGNNPTGAWFSGINVKRHNLVLFALVGLMAGLAAVLLTSGSAAPVRRWRWAGSWRSSPWRCSAASIFSAAPAAWWG